MDKQPLQDSGIRPATRAETAMHIEGLASCLDSVLALRSRLSELEALLAMAAVARRLRDGWSYTTASTHGTEWIRTNPFFIDGDIAGYDEQAAPAIPAEVAAWSALSSKEGEEAR